MLRLRPQDVVVAMAAGLTRPGQQAMNRLAASAGLGLAETYTAVRRGVQAGLLVRPPAPGRGVLVLRENLLEFLVHGVRYAFPAVCGRITRGVPTAHSAPVLASRLSGGEAAALVWPTPEGTSRGESLAPLHSGVPRAAAADPAMYEALALVDAIRAGGARVRELAVALLRQRFIGEV